MVQMRDVPVCVHVWIFVWMCELKIQTEPELSPLLYIYKSQDVFHEDKGTEIKIRVKVDG